MKLLLQIFLLVFLLTLSATAAAAEPANWQYITERPEGKVYCDLISIQPDSKSPTLIYYREKTVLTAKAVSYLEAMDIPSGVTTIVTWYGYDTEAGKVKQLGDEFVAKDETVLMRSDYRETNSWEPIAQEWKNYFAKIVDLSKLPEADRSKLGQATAEKK